MTALAAPRPTPKRPSFLFSRAVAAGVNIHQGSLVALNAAGFAVPGATSATLTGDGMAKDNADNSGGANGAIRVEVEHSTFQFANSAGADEVTIASIGKDAFIVDDQTVAKTNGGNTRSVAGKIVDVDAQGVWVRFH